MGSGLSTVPPAPRMGLGNDQIRENISHFLRPIELSRVLQCCKGKIENSGEWDLLSKDRAMLKRAREEWQRIHKLKNVVTAKRDAYRKAVETYHICTGLVADSSCELHVLVPCWSKTVEEKKQLLAKLEAQQKQTTRSDENNHLKRIEQ